MRVLKTILNFIGINRNSKFVKAYLNESNVRSSLFMSAVIIGLELWMIIRQTEKYLIPKWPTGDYFSFVLSYISLFILFITLGCAIFVFCLTNIYKKIPSKTSFILNLVFSGISFLYSFYIFGENFSKWDTTKGQISNILLIALYAFTTLASGLILFFTLWKKFKNKDIYFLINTIIILFAVICLFFGVRVSYSDHISSKHKEIICFLTMAIYVACLLIWKPWISVVLNVSVFIAFYFLINAADVASGYGPEDVLAFKDGDLVNYITFFVSLTMISILMYHQRLISAKKDEELTYIADYDELTGLHNFSFLVRTLDETITDNEGKIILFINIGNFKTYNDQRGFIKGNEFLKSVGELIEEEFEGGIVCRQSDDHYVVAINSEEYIAKLQKLNYAVLELDHEVQPHIYAGGYLIKNGEAARRAVDKARYACSVASSKMQDLFVEYDLKMHKEYHLMQYVINHVDEAVEKGWIKPYYQPVVWSKDGKLCGAEALARWEDPEKGMLPPISFVPTLENTKLVHKLDACIIESVFRDMREAIDRNMPVFPVSLNISRLDFELMDVVPFLEEMVRKYNIDKHFIHVEITESALTENAELLSKNIHDLKEKGYALWLDDFGSGYSSLNVLKDYDFDVLKLDMKFLSGFENNPKARPLIEAVISMANKLGMKTLSEGVETQLETDFLKEAQCGRLQGYLFGKPMPKEKIRDMINKGEFTISKELV